jgi:ferrous iron transport protein B
MPDTQNKRPVVAIAGQPNTGKSTLFNALTGLHQAVGNWPGKTVEKKSGQVLCGKTRVEVVDLPGTYSLTAGSTEERIARDFILDGGVDLVLVVANALCLERTLYYGAEIAAMGIPYVVALNMTDMAEDAGVFVNPGLVARGLGVPVFPLVASRGKGIARLKDGLEQSLSGLNGSGEGIEWLSGDMESLHKDLAKKTIPLAKTGRRGAWDALKLMEEDPDVRQDLAAKDNKVLKWADRRLAGFSHLSEQLAELKYRWIRKAVAHSPGEPGLPGIQIRKWDRIATHPFWGVVLLLAIFVAVVTAGLAAGLSFGLFARAGFDEVEAVAGRLLAFPQMPWLAWVVRGAIRGFGSVVTVTPVIAIFSMIFALLEDIGYLARAAYVMDRLMTRIGLNGRAFVPLLFGMPCTILGALACRIGDSGRQRLLTLLLVPLVPCSAKLAISSVVASWFFSLPAAVGVVLGLFLVNCIILGVLCRFFDRMLFPGRSPDPLIMELPPYQNPAWRAILKHTWNRAVSFVKKAAGVLVAFSVLLSFACYFPTGEINTSLFGRLGQALEPVSRLMGLDWKMLTILLASLLNKEAILATAAVIFNVGQQELPALMQATVSVSGAVTFMYAMNLFVPCVAALGVIYTEGGKRTRLLAGIIGYTTVLSIGGGILIHQVIRLVAG